jgi:hypothetical protein
MDDAVVSLQFFFEGGADPCPELVGGTGPVRETVNRPSIAQDDRRCVLVSDAFQLSLDVKDRPLRGAFAVEIVFSWKSTAKYDARGFRQNFDVQAEGLANQLQKSRLACSRPARKHDPFSLMRLGALTRNHRSSLSFDVFPR